MGFSLRASEAPEDATQGMYRLSHASIYSVVSPRQILRKLAREQLKLNPAHQLVVLHMRLLTRACHNVPRVCTSVFSFTDAAI